MTPLPDRFWAKTRRDENGCLLWTGSLNNQGYSQFFLAGRVKLGHRVAYEFMVGEIPEGMQIDHLCRNRDCVNPEHLEAVSPAENNRRRPYGPGGGQPSVTHEYDTWYGHVVQFHAAKGQVARKCELCRAA